MKEKLQIRTYRELHDLYLAVDVAGLVDIMEDLRATTYKAFKVDLVHTFGLPTLAKSIVFKMIRETKELTGVDGIELLETSDLYKFFDESKVGGIAMSKQQHSDLQQRLLPQRAPSPPAPARRLPSPAQRAPSPEPGLLRQKTVCPLLIEQLASALTLVRSIGLELEGGLVLPPSTPVRKQHLSNREVATVSEELLGMARSAIEELAQVGYTDVEVLQMLQQQSPALAWLGDRSLKSVKVGGAGGRRALKGRLNKWWELQTAKARTRLGAAPSEQLCERKKRQAELLVKLRDSVLMLDAAVQIGVAEAEDDLCTICMERPRTVVLQHVLRRAEDRHQVCHECIAVLLQTNARCPFCNEAVAYG
ncbi:hypothetical protein T492DRAFT_910862 [Pavlovales sp. CCMP2436]|nr:hypothetical protein T492DRAFT_910862 [Pavlovales sp. CCMP2436]